MSPLQHLAILALLSQGRRYGYDPRAEQVDEGGNPLRDGDLNTLDGAAALVDASPTCSRVQRGPARRDCHGQRLDKPAITPVSLSESFVVCSRRTDATTPDRTLVRSAWFAVSSRQTNPAPRAGHIELAGHEPGRR